MKSWSAFEVRTSSLNLVYASIH